MRKKKIRKTHKLKTKKSRKKIKDTHATLTLFLIIILILSASVLVLQQFSEEKDLGSHTIENLGKTPNVTKQNTFSNEITIPIIVTGK